MSRFQLAFLSIMVVLGVVGAILFAVSKNNLSSQTAAHVTMWGTLDQSAVTDFISKVEPDNQQTINVTYVQKSPATFESDLVSALASGAGPDMVLLPQDLILRQLDKFYVVPFSSYSERSYLDSFIPESQLYLTSSGIIGFPFTVDPMVMYWNRDIFTNAGIANPPTTWEDFFTLVPKLTHEDQNGNITASAVALGESSNIVHFKDILALLDLQAGTPIVAPSAQGDLQSALADAGGNGLVPGEEALSYFTQFSDPVKSTYSWNGALPNDRDAFVAGDLAVYFGYASELSSLRSRNPNLNFDVAPMPQSGANKATFGNMTAIAVLKSSPNVPAAYVAAATLSSLPLQTEWVKETGLPPVRRDMLSTLPGDAYKSVFYQSALWSKAWLDPNSGATTQIFANMVDAVTSGRLRVSEAVQQASTQIDTLLKNTP